MKHRAGSILMLGVVLALIIAACGGEKASPTPQPATPTTKPAATATAAPTSPTAVPATATPKPAASPTSAPVPTATSSSSQMADKQEFTWAGVMIPSINGMKEAEKIPQTAAFDRLVNLNSDGKLVPQIATSWQMTAPTTWRFTLRNDVKWHDGVAMTAADVENSINLTLKSKWLQSGQALTNIIGAKAIDDKTVELTTKTTDVFVPRRQFYTYVLPKHILDNGGEEALIKNPIGTGPFKITSYTSGDKLVLDRVSYQHPFRKPALQRATFLNVTEISTALAALRAGKVNMTQFVVDPEEMKRLTNEGYQVKGSPAYVLTTYMDPVDACQQKWPTCDKRVRQALNLALDRELLSKTIWGGLAAPLSQPSNPNGFGYDPSLKVQYDPKKAEQLMDAAGFPRGAGGTRFTLKMMDWAPGPTHDTYLAMIDMWQKVGVVVQNQTVELAVLRSYYTHEKTPPPEMIAIRADDKFGDNTAYLSRTGPTAFNRYDNPDYVQLTKEIQVTTDEAARLTMMRRIMGILVDDPPYIYSVSSPEMFQMDKRVESFVYLGNLINFDIDQLWINRK